MPFLHVPVTAQLYFKDDPHMRRLEIPEEMQRKHGFAALGPADGTVKSAIFGYNAARFYKLDLRAELPPMKEDGLAKLKAAYLQDRPLRSNTAYGFVARG